MTYPPKGVEGYPPKGVHNNTSNNNTKKKISEHKKIEYLSLHTKKTEQDIKDRIYELYDKDIISQNISKYKLLVLFITK